MDDTLYSYSSLSSILQVGRLLHCEDEEYSVYYIVKRRGGVRHLLLLSSLQLGTQPTFCFPVHDWGQGVDCIHHPKEERRSTLHTPSCAFTPHCNGICVILLLVLYLANRLHPPPQGWGVCCTLHCKEESRSTLSNPPLDDTHLVIYSSCFSLFPFVGFLRFHGRGNRIRAIGSDESPCHSPGTECSSFCYLWSPKQYEHLGRAAAEECASDQVFRLKKRYPRDQRKRCSILTHEEVGVQWSDEGSFKVFRLKKRYSRDQRKRCPTAEIMMTMMMILTLSFILLVFHCFIF